MSLDSLSDLTPQLDAARRDTELPREVRALLEDADARIDGIIKAGHDRPSRAFVPSDYDEVWRALQALERSGLCPGEAFLEWGSGIGVVVALAALAGFSAAGIELETDLHDEGEAFLEAHAIDAELVCGSFVPREGQELLEELRLELAWLETAARPAYDLLGAEVSDFDLVYVYPWPGEEAAALALFAATAEPGSLLLSYHGLEDFRLHRRD